ncbi:Putative neurobeachin homolog [Geodia barretti]|nr:Putative neurobeachin homolog [Geodia barretti]
MLAVMIEVVCSLHTSTCDWEEADTLMRMQLFSYITSLCAQNQTNCKALLRLTQWQHWLLDLADQQDASEGDRESLQELLYQLFHSLLLYCFQEEQDGWRVWVETTAAIHSHLSAKVMQSLPSSSSIPSSSSPSSPSSSTEGIRDDPPSSSSSSLPSHQLRTSLTADTTTDAGLRDKDGIETETHERGGGAVEDCDGPHVQRVGVDASRQMPNNPGTREGEREGEEVKAGGVDSRKQGVSSSDGALTETETSPEMLTNAKEVDMSNTRPEKTSGSITPSSSLPPSLPDMPQRMRRLNRPPPLATPTATPPLLMSSKESPTSPFFIPSNPFLSVVGRMPRFQWAAVHVSLLDSLLRSLLNIIQKWSTDNRMPSKSLGEDGNKYLRSNVAHLLALVSDVLVEMNGGLKQLLAKAANPVLSDRIRLTKSFRGSIGPTLKSTLATDGVVVRSLLSSVLALSEVMVVSGLLKLGVVETRMKMDQGGMYRQALRLVLIDACLITMECNIKNKVYQEHYQQTKKTIEKDFRETEALLEALGISDSSLKKYFRRGMEGKMENLRDSQCLLSDHTLSPLARLLDRDTEGKQLQERIAKATVYFLAILCVSKYRSILEAVGRDIAEDAPTVATTNEEYGGRGADEGTQISTEGEKFGPLSAGEEGVTNSRNQEKGERRPSLEAVDGNEEKGVEEEGMGEGEKERRDIQRPMSVETDSTATPDLEQTFHFPVDGERTAPSVAGGAGPVPASVVFYRQSMDTSEQIRAALAMVGPFLCRVLVGQKSGLGRLLVGSDGRPLLNDAVCRLAENQSLVEITMLLCSQEWQSSLAKNGVKAFADLLAEGRSMVQFCEGYLRSVASRKVADFKSTAESQLQHFTVFEEQLSVYLSQAVRSSCEVAQLRRAEWRRDTMYARDLWRKVSSVVDEYGKFDRSPMSCQFLKMDLREDSQRQRLKLVANTHGTLHEDARRTMPAEEVDEGEGGINEGLDHVGMPLQSGPLTSSSQADEGSLGSDELLETQVTEQEQTRKLWSVQCKMLVMARALPGNLVFSLSSLSFNADDDSEEFGHLSPLMDYYAMNERWELSQVRAVFSRRYLHQNKALEIFFTDRSSAFLVFSSPREVREVVKRLPKVGTGAEYDLPQSRSTSLAQPHQLFRRSSVTAKWQRREISNFDYLMYLNTITGRTYNDLNQYPIFPWVLADYSSNILDLDDPSSFRDLSKPVGALNGQRLARLEERLESWEDERIPPFLYGTHYSTMAFVLHWLVRVEPFTTAHIQFHDGVFDQGSRMFNSILQSWNNVCSDSANVKELIPELFYLPEMLTNHNKFYLGRRGACEEGEVIGDVDLPPWADSPQEFIHLHREALESEYVSRNLHHWIDLIFGCKQRGEESVKAKNTFYYLTYQGSIDLDATTDPQLRKGLEDQIRHFGQTPSQLLTEPHPSRHPCCQGEPSGPHPGGFPSRPSPGCRATGHPGHAHSSGPALPLLLPSLLHHLIFLLLVLLC